MIWRVLLTVLYACAFGALMVAENLNPGMSEAPLVAIWVAGAVVGLLVGRWWVLGAFLGAVVGRAIGWDMGENDGNPALWPPYVVGTLILVGIPLLLGLVASQGLQEMRRRRDA